MDLFIKLALLVIFFGVMVAVGLYCRRHATDVNGFVLGGRSVGPWLTAFAYGTSYFSAVVFVGYAGQFGWKYGIAATWAGIGNALLGSLLAWAVLGRRTRVMTQHIGSRTMPDFFGLRYKSKALRLIAAAIVSFVVVVMEQNWGQLFEPALILVIVILNANKQPAKVQVPQGQYTVVCQSGLIVPDGICPWSGNTVEVAPQEAMILHN